MKIGFIDNFDSFVYNLVRYVRETTTGEVCIQRNNEINFKELDSCDAILLSPGPGIPEEAGDLLKVIDRYHATKPLFGVCLGHQALGVYFKNELVQCPFPIHGKSSTIITQNEGVLFKDLAKELQVGRYHSWQLKLDNSSELKPTAFDIDGTLMAFEHATKPIHGVQFHPESILTPDGRKMIANWMKQISN